MEQTEQVKKATSLLKTKKALIASAVCTFLCGLLLLSTSIAWFSDTQDSGANELYAGNLDIELLYSKTMGENSWATVASNTDIFKVNVEGETEPQNMLWEPGAINVVYFKVENKGSLAAKYDFTVEIPENGETPGTNLQGEEFKLSDYIYGGVVNVDAAFAGTDENAKRTAAISAIGSTAKKLSEINGAPLITGEKLDGSPADNTTKTFALVLYMPQYVLVGGENVDVGAKINYPTPDNETENPRPKVQLKIKLVATQDVGESDSFGNQYDNGAVYTDVTAATVADFTSAISDAQDGAVIGIVGNNLELTQNLTINKNITIVGDSEHAIENYPTYIGAENTVTFKNVNFDKTTSTDNASSVYGQGFKGTLIFDGCTFDLNRWEAIQITPAGDCTIIIKNCTFNGFDGAKRFIHIQPAKDNTFKLNVTVTNCIFNNCDKVNYGSAEDGKGDVIDLDYFAPGSTITMGDNTFNLSSGVEGYTLHPYFCTAGDSPKTVETNNLLGYLKGNINTYEVTTTDGLQLKAN